MPSAGLFKLMASGELRYVQTALGKLVIPEDLERLRGKCQALKKDGSPCTAPILASSEYCFRHDPDLAEERRAASAKGEHNRGNVMRLRNMAPARLLPVYDRLERALEEVHEGRLNPGQAQAMAALARALAAILQAGELEQRLRRLEQDAPPQPKSWR